jgi:prepilin-type processing-associated H-X9-DG protein
VAHNEAFPPNTLFNSFGVPWDQNVAILPELERRDLYNAINLGQAMDSPSNTTIARISPDVFLCPSDEIGLIGSYGVCNYTACSGSGLYPGGFDIECVGAFADGLFASRNGPMNAADCVDGLSHTAAFSERLHGAHLPSDALLIRPWPVNAIFLFDVSPATQSRLLWQCENLDTVIDLSFVRPGVPWFREFGYTHLVTPNRLSCFAGNIGNYFSPMPPSSRHSNGVNLLFGDGHVRFLGDNISIDVWRALGSRNGSENVDGRF